MRHLLPRKCGLFGLATKRSLAGSFRFMSTASEWVSSDFDTSKGIVTLTMQRPPVNSLSLEMLQTMTEAIKEAEKMSKIQALILQSSSPTIFSAGLDLAEMHNPDLDRLTSFWSAFQDLYFALYGSRLACVAAIEGHAPAAGCMLAISCDYRVMAASFDKFRPSIGLNETKVGITAPPWLAQQMIDTVGRRQAEVALQLGQLYTSEEALEISLVDEVVTKNDVRQRAEEMALQFAQIPPQARLASKMLIRKERMETLEARRQDDIDYFVNFITNEKVQANLSAYLEMLAKRKKK